MSNEPGKSDETAEDGQQPQGEMTFVEHLVELRDRLLRVVLAVLVFLVVLFPFANDLYALLAEPLLRRMPEGATMIATQVASPFLTPFKLTIVLSMVSLKGVENTQNNGQRAR